MPSLVVIGLTICSSALVMWLEANIAGLRQPAWDRKARLLPPLGFRPVPDDAARLAVGGN